DPGDVLQNPDPREPGRECVVEPAERLVRRHHRRRAVAALGAPLAVHEAVPRSEPAVEGDRLLYPDGDRAVAADVDEVHGIAAGEAVARSRERIQRQVEVAKGVTE